MASPLVTCKKGPSITHCSPRLCPPVRAGLLQMLARAGTQTGSSSRLWFVQKYTDTHMTVQAALKKQENITKYNQYDPVKIFWRHILNMQGAYLWRESGVIQTIDRHVKCWDTGSQTPDSDRRQDRVLSDWRVNFLIAWYIKKSNNPLILAALC